MALSAKRFFETVVPTMVTRSFADFLEAKTARNEVVRLADQLGAFAQVVHEVDAALGVATVDEGKFDGRARVAAVHEDK